MSKQQLIEFAAEEANVSKAEVGRVLDALTKGIVKGLKEDGKVALIGFGTFTAKKRAARDGINPLTKEPLHIPEKVVPSFKAGSKLKDELN
jgi:DNA-binding protein HU-beta